MVCDINLEPLIDAHFETTDEGEATFIIDVIRSIENGSPWPRRLYDSGAASKCMGPTACKALGVVLEEIKDMKEPWFPDDSFSESSEEEVIIDLDWYQGINIFGEWYHYNLALVPSKCQPHAREIFQRIK
ncbi:hypothetical protein BVRB_5g103820 [Beta vulgaris subsp. vulgaris]|nr:hypothetical protein BVRB_5g103820 [Beta vulgaris subsp. vulgaris]